MPDDDTPPPAPYERERRATDGLNWTSAAAAPTPVSTEPAAPVARLGAPAEPVAPTPSARQRRRLPPVATHGISALAGGVIAATIVAAVVGGKDSSPAPGAATSAPSTTLTVQQTSAITDAAGKARPSVLRIESQRRTQRGIETEVGSGVVLDLEGHIITNAHVVLNTDSLKVILPDGTSRPGILLGTDYPFTDLAVLQIGPGSLSPVDIGDSSALKLGETVVAIGNPLGDFDGTVTVGVVSGLNRQRTFDAVRQDDIIQTDAAVNNGNSGGALVNLKGQFVGMPTAILRQSTSAGTANVEGIAFALPSNRLLAVAKKIISEGSYPRPSLGLDHVDLTPEVLSRFPRTPVEEGAFVTAVAKSGVGEAAGIQPGDVITRVGDSAVNRQNPLLNGLMKYDPGQAIRVVLNRNGRIIEVEVRLAKRT